MENFISDLKTVTLLGKDGLKLAYTALSGFAMILTIVVALVLFVSYLIIKKDKSKLANFKNLALGVVIGYTVTISLVISFFMIARLSVKEELDKNFYLMLGFFALLIIYTFSAVFTSMANKKAFRICNYIGISLSVIYALILLLMLPTVDSAYKPLSTPLMYTLTAIIIIITVLLALFFGKDNGSVSQTKCLSYAGVCIALSFALSYIKLFSLPQGGSVTLASMLPLIIFAYVFGARKGILAGVVYGVLQFLQSPQVYEPMQVLLDYPIAFGVIGLAGIVKNMGFIENNLVKFILGASIACIFRYFAHVLSGIFVFSSWAMEGYTAISWGIVYNLYILAELAIILIVGIPIFSSKALSKQLTTINPPLIKD